MDGVELMKFFGECRKRNLPPQVVSELLRKRNEADGVENGVFFSVPPARRHGEYKGTVTQLRELVVSHPTWAVGELEAELGILRGAIGRFLQGKPGIGKRRATKQFIIWRMEARDKGAIK